MIFDWEKSTPYAAYYQSLDREIHILGKSIQDSYPVNWSHLVSLKDLTSCLMMHELGHSIDPLVEMYNLEEIRLNRCFQKAKESQNFSAALFFYEHQLRIRVLSEIRAWKFARKKFGHQLDKEVFYLVARKSLKQYFVQSQKMYAKTSEKLIKTR